MTVQPFSPIVRWVATGLSAASCLLFVPAAQASPDASHTVSHAASTKDNHANSIVGVASSNSSFDVLTALLKRAGLVDVLDHSGDFTVFAPTDAAFGALPDGTIESLFQPENQELLVSILTYHVVPGRVTSDQLSAGDVATVEGNQIAINLSQGVMINDATVVQADVAADNGVIHVIDQVLLPPTE